MYIYYIYVPTRIQACIHNVTIHICIYIYIHIYTAGPKDFDGFVYALVVPLPPIDSSKFYSITIVCQGGGVDRY